MTEIFLYIVNMSITASILAVVILLLRLLRNNLKTYRFLYNLY